MARAQLTFVCTARNAKDAIGEQKHGELLELLLAIAQPEVSDPYINRPFGTWGKLAESLFSPDTWV